MKKMATLARIGSFVCTLLCFGAHAANAQTNKILMFVAHEETYYSEYMVSLKALETAGYTVEVRTVSALPATSYMIPASTTIEETANTLAGSSYSQFQSQFLQLFGSHWDAAWNTITPLINTAGSILQLNNMDDFDALVLPGGTGTIAYRLDGSYSPHGVGSREISAATVQAVAEKLNALALDALAKGKPVLAQCHGAALPVFWRIPNTSGPGAEQPGYSLLKNQSAAGFPDAATGVTYNSLNVTYRADDPLHISALHTSFTGKKQGDYRLLTSRDWYPQTIAHATRALLNVLRSYPDIQTASVPLPVLILHGGAVDTNNCSPANLSNDIPCNHAGVRPADYTHLAALLQQTPADSFHLVVSDLNISAANLPFDASDSASIGNYLHSFAGIVFFKHWATSLTDAMQLALIRYAEDGGGITALHHALYNREEAGGLNKNLLVQQLFEAESAAAGFGFQLMPYILYNSNAGHFVSGYSMPYTAAPAVPGMNWNQTPGQAINLSGSGYPNFGIDDELYTNMTFLPSAVFGSGVNQILPLFSNSVLGAGGVHTSGFAKRVNRNNDPLEGKLVYLQPGERIGQYQLPQPHAQLIRNAVYWTARKEVINTTAVNKLAAEPLVKIFPNPADDMIHISSSEAGTWRFTDLTGKNTGDWKKLENGQPIPVNQLPAGIYLLECRFSDGSTFTTKWVKNR